ncbi:MAG: hypothetical protein HYV47_02545 [Candidatus Nealsonbacteria bacterium]|nr:hypothetical protein [Candidatus Nealsonbacteria bacterium]
MVERNREREPEQPPDGDDNETVEATVRWLGQKDKKLRVQRGGRLSDFLKKQGVTVKGYALYFNSRKLRVNEEGELEDDPEVTADFVLEILVERITGG